MLHGVEALDLKPPFRQRLEKYMPADLVTERGGPGANASLSFSARYTCAVCERTTRNEATNS